MSSLLTAVDLFDQLHRFLVSLRFSRPHHIILASAVARDYSLTTVRRRSNIRRKHLR
jgi:hypothetical protein